MRRFPALVGALLAGLLVAGCGSSGNSADPPASIALVAGDGVVTVTWPMASGVEYWLFYGPTANITTSNWTLIPDSKLVGIGAGGVASPYVTTGLTNGTLYSFTLNGRTDGGPGGAGTPSVSATPRLAGTATAGLPAPWTAPTVNTVPATSDLRGLTWGTTLVAVGAGGLVYSSPDGVTWTAVTSPLANNLNAAAYASVYHAVGDGGAILYSVDAITWTEAASSRTATTNALNGIASALGRSVAVGAGGTIIVSTDVTNWSEAASSRTVTTKDLNAVLFNGVQWIAVGAEGTVIASTDASANTWTSVRSNAAFAALQGITFGTNATTSVPVYVAVGAGGTVLTSADALTWTPQAALGTNTLNAVTSVTNSATQTSGTQFVAVGDSGTIYTSIDGTSWALQPSTTLSNLKALVHAAYSYAAVGASGTNLLAQ